MHGFGRKMQSRTLHVGTAAPDRLGSASVDPRPSRRHQSAPLKRILGAERTTGALAIVNHHSNRFRSLLAAFGDDMVGGIVVEYLPPRMITERSIRHQLCRRAHMYYNENLLLIVSF